MTVRRLLIAWLGLALSLLCWGLATEANLLQARLTTGSNVTFDPAKLGANVSLSAGNLTATFASGSAASTGGALSTTSHTTGKYHFEITFSNIYNDGPILGISGNSYPNTLYCGKDAFSVGIGLVSSVANDLILFQGGTAQHTYPVTTAVNDVYAVEIDVGAGLIWFQNVTKGTGWTNGTNNTFTGSPSAGTGGFAYTATGNIYICTAGVGDAVAAGTPGNVATLNAAGPFALTPTSGFSAW